MWFPSCQVEAYYWRVRRVFIGPSVCVYVCVDTCVHVCACACMSGYRQRAQLSDECVWFVLSCFIAGLLKPVFSANARGRWLSLSLSLLSLNVFIYSSDSGHLYSLQHTIQCVYVRC